MEPPVRTTSPAAIRRVPFSPPAASAAGGSGSHGSRHVYSVGLSRCLPAASWRRWRGRSGVLVAAVISSGGGALRRATTDPPPSPRARLRGGAVRSLPVPVAVEWRRRFRKLLKVMIWRTRSRATASMQGGGSLELRTVDFPSAMGLSPIQGCSGGAAAARRQSVLVNDGVFVVSAGLVCNFLFLEDCLVRTLV